MFETVCFYKTNIEVLLLGTKTPQVPYDRITFSESPEELERSETQPYPRAEKKNGNTEYFKYVAWSADTYIGSNRWGKDNNENGTSAYSYDWQKGAALQCWVPSSWRDTSTNSKHRIKVPLMFTILQGLLLPCPWTPQGRSSDLLGWPHLYSC